MSEPYLSAVLEETERVAEQHDQIARSTDDPAHEYLRYGVLRPLEGEADETAADVPETDGVTVGYGADEAMFDSWGDDVEWWNVVPPQEKVKSCLRRYSQILNRSMPPKNETGGAAGTRQSRGSTVGSTCAWTTGR